MFSPIIPSFPDWKNTRATHYRLLPSREAKPSQRASLEPRAAFRITASIINVSNTVTLLN